MHLKFSYDEPIGDANSRAILKLGWQWICELMDIRANIEAGCFKATESDFDEMVDYFSKFTDPRGFINLSDSFAMPSDARVDFIYIPTTVACGIMNLLREHLDTQIHDRTIRLSLEASAGRRFNGHGYDGHRYMVYQLELMEWGTYYPNV